ncbi:helix-turn-helix transcriptional regulator [Streptomyces albidoflavus]|uniref:helix-turn-helix transcriptional regulator n=1 Tax=Streptomyces albidoflavus TaxID=1886 RepID=UPI0033CAA086
MSTTLERRVNETIRLLMARTGETTTSLAEDLGVSRQALAGRLAGRSQWHIDHLPDVADHYGLTVCDLITGYASIDADRLPPSADSPTQNRRETLMATEEELRRAAEEQERASKALAEELARLDKEGR